MLRKCGICGQLFLIRYKVTDKKEGLIVLRYNFTRDKLASLASMSFYSNNIKI